MRVRCMGLIRGALIVLGAACVFLGVTRGEHQAVLQKAVTVCLECIGIG